MFAAPAWPTGVRVKNHVSDFTGQTVPAMFDVVPINQPGDDAVFRPQQDQAFLRVMLVFGESGIGHEADQVVHIYGHLSLQFATERGTDIESFSPIGKMGRGEHLSLCGIGDAVSSDGNCAEFSGPPPGRRQKVVAGPGNFLQNGRSRPTWIKRGFAVFLNISGHVSQCRIETVRHDFTNKNKPMQRIKNKQIGAKI